MREEPQQSNCQAGIVSSHTGSLSQMALADVIHAMNGGGWSHDLFYYRLLAPDGATVSRLAILIQCIHGGPGCGDLVSNTCIM